MAVFLISNERKRVGALIPPPGSREHRTIKEISKNLWCAYICGIKGRGIEESNRKLLFGTRISTKDGDQGHFVNIDYNKSDRVTISNDSFDVYQVYYGNDGSSFAISNDMHAVARSLGKFASDDVGLYNAVFGALPIKRTPFAGVYKLQGMIEQIVIQKTGSTWTLVQEPCVHCRTHTIISEDLQWNVDCVVAQCRKLTEAINQESIELNFTGGMDSRLVLAMLLSDDKTKKRTKLKYGVGNTMHTNTKSEDLELAKQFARHFSLELDILDWSKTNEVHEPISLGIDGHIYGGFKGFIGSCIRPLQTVSMGGFCPIFSNHDYFEQEFTNLDDVVDDAMPRESKSIFTTTQGKNIFSDLRREVYQYAEDLMNNNVVSHYPQPFLAIRYMLYLGSEKENPNYFQRYQLYLAPFMTGNILESLLQVPPPLMHGRRFQVELTNALFAGLYKFPIFSGLASRKLSDNEVLGSSSAYSDSSKASNSNFALLRRSYFHWRNRSKPEMHNLKGFDSSCLDERCLHRLRWIKSFVK